MMTNSAKTLIAIVLTFGAMSVVCPIRLAAESGDLYQRFRQQTALQLDEAEASVSDKAGERLSAFIAEGARTLEEDEASESQVNEAGRTLKRFVRLLLEAGRGPEGDIRIGEAEFNRVAAGFCPFYPFC